MEQSQSQEDFNCMLEKLRLEQNLSFAIIASLVSAIVMAILWAILTITSGYQFSIMAIVVGLSVGFAVRFAGKGIDGIYGWIGAIGALLACIIGNFFSYVGYISLEPESDMSYFESMIFLLSNMQITAEIMLEVFSPIDLIFYVFAVFEGYRFSFRKIDSNRFS
ncbi:MAG: hypothetical protein H3C31_12010 [Brumimicrobium sp.]|nr:hypothetical protein [Brumimicrobium sp.]